jgi:hypothetical protein
VFRIPEALGDTSVVTIEERELDDLLEGIDVERARKRRAPRRPRVH